MPAIKPIRKLLIANRGEIARRVIRTAREMGIRTVAVFSEPDAGAPFVREADEAVALGGASPSDSYLRIDAITKAARATRADAIHPGYGFLAENAGFARACADAGVRFVGPTAEAIEAMGSKIEAKRRMEEAGVPVLHGETVSGLDGDELAAAAERVGYPLLAKASAGGGGKGMRVVRAPAELADSVAAARREASGAFGDDALFLERYVERSRHVEIQILGDAHGTVIHLGERECSIQRRHQKVLEESPSVVVDDALRARMGDAAVAAGKAIGYRSAGTVEFLLAPEGEFSFLEVNTRLQVEHPVTELVTGLDLVRAQLEVAEGARLAGGGAPAPRGHAIEVRLYAEDPANDFLPVTGTLARFRVPAAAGVRVDTGVEDGAEISPHYDPMVAKVIAHAPTRLEAARRLAAALRATELHGTRTNRDFLVRLLEHPEFLAGRTDTGFLERHDPAELGAPLLDAATQRIAAAAAALAAQEARRGWAAVLPDAPSGWRNNRSQDQSVRYEAPAGEVEVSYRLGRSGALEQLVVTKGSDPLTIEAELGECTPERVELTVGGVRRTYSVNRAEPAIGEDEAVGPVEVWVNTSEGQVDLRELPRFPDAGAEDAPGSLKSPMPGSVIRVTAEVGAEVERGQPLVVIEAMKMEHEITAPASGVVAEIRVGPGDQVEAEQVLVVIGDPDAEG